jgi:hypothetical protein
MSYAYGYIFPAGGELWGCIMSYVGFENAHRLNYFSNPDKTYKGAPMGIPKGRPNAADNVRRINVTAPVVAAYRSGIGSTSRVPVLASPPRLDFPATPVGSISPQRSLRLAYSSASIQRPIRITDFQVTGDASAFQVQIFDNNTKQFISGNSFTIAPPDSIQLVVRFQPSSSQAAEANIIFKADDPSFRYDLPPIRLTGNVAAPLLKNISTRGYVGTGDNVLIGGLIIGGTSSREVLIRAVGGSLAGLGVAQALRDPVIELYHGSTLIARNDDWGDGFGYEPIRWSGFAPADDLESAVLTRLEPGNYTAIVHGFGDATGVALIEAYDLEVNPGTELLNISTRGQVQTGDNVMIGGFILGGTSPTRVVVRAIGPSLTERGVSSPLQDPTLDLHNSEGTRIASNDNWRSDDESGIVGTGIAPHDDREAALVATLPPSGYTAIVRGANQTRGVALVEVYKTAAE